MLSERERLERAVESVVGMIIFNSAGAIIGSNEVFRHITGYTREEVESGTLHWRMLTPPEWIAESQRQMEQLASTGRIGPYEKEYFLKDGSRRWMLFTGRKLDDNRTLEVCVDITPRRQAELAAQNSERQRKELIADLAHAVNNPLQIAMHALHLLRPDLPQNGAANALEEAVQKIHALNRSLIEAAGAVPQTDETEILRGDAPIDHKYGT